MGSDVVGTQMCLDSEERAARMYRGGAAFGGRGSGVIQRKGSLRVGQGLRHDLLPGSSFLSVWSVWANAG